jgi:hypothetical protein
VVAHEQAVLEEENKLRCMVAKALPFVVGQYPSWYCLVITGVLNHLRQNQIWTLDELGTAARVLDSYLSTADMTMHIARELVTKSLKLVASTLDEVRLCSIAIVGEAALKLLVPRVCLRCKQRELHKDFSRSGACKTSTWM